MDQQVERVAGPSTLMIEMVDVVKRYGSKPAVDHLHLQVHAGELFAFLGPNGAGKTTTIKMLAGLLRPTSGVIRVAGIDMAERSANTRRLLSYVPDTPYVYEKLTGREFLQFIRELYGLSSPDYETEQNRLVRVLEMESYIDDLAETYSHGMRQRLAFAGAFLHRPKVLILDEPMVGLDPKSVRIVKDMLRAATQEGTTVFMSTHTLAMAEEMADRIGILLGGKLVRCGRLQELRDSFGASGLSLEDYFLHVTAEAEST